MAWFESRRDDPRSRIFVVEESGRPVGVVRFDLKGESEAVVSVNLDPAVRGRGVAPQALRQACRQLATEQPAVSVTAYIKVENLPSLRAFARAGFVHAGTSRRGSDAVVMRWKPDAPDR